MKVQQIITLLESTFPLKDACDWDYTGWQIKTENLDLTVTNILLALDVSNQVVEMAIKNKVNLIICHHPFFFKTQLDDIKDDSWKYHLYKTLVENNINVYVMHTNFDKNANGMNMLMAKGLKLNDIQYFNDEKLAVTGNYDCIPLKIIIENIKKYFDCTKVKVLTNNVNNKINQVILSAGGGGPLIHQLADYSAIEKPNVLFITGEMKWHQQVETWDKNINTIIVGHNMEEKFVDFISAFLSNNIKQKITIQKFFFKKSFFL